MSKIKCFKCKGKGYLNPVNLVSAVFSFGITALMDKSDHTICDACIGTGYLEEAQS
jgi:hypothetical protein